MPAKPIEPGTEWTSPDNRGVCGFCGGVEGGYAKRDADGKWQAACWPCVKPKKTSAPPKKKPIECPPIEDLDLDHKIAHKDFKFDVPRIGRNSTRAKREVKETTDASSTDSTVHVRGAELVADKPAAVRRRKVGTDGERR